MSGLILALVALGLAALPCGLFFANLRGYRSPAAPSATPVLPRVSVLIPARNEAASIRACVESALASEGVELEVVVLDDDSTDATAAIVAGLAAEDPRVRLLHGGHLPNGWCGKQYACQRLAQAAREPLLLFVDADVRLTAQGVARCAAFLEQTGAALVSGFPHQVTQTWLERLLIPLMHFVLLGFLPLGRMRASTHPAYGAGCGQLMLARRDDYFQAGGHAAIRASLHDGLQLPRAFRSAGLATDLFDATDVASCRMYRNAGEVWHGLAKNADEGLAAPRTIVPATIMLVGGQVLPFVLVALFAAGRLSLGAGCLALVAAAAALAPRAAAAVKFRQSLRGVLGHPLGVTLLLAIQWQAVFRRVLRRKANWKGRQYGTEVAPQKHVDASGATMLNVDSVPATSRLR